MLGQRQTAGRDGLLVAAIGTAGPIGAVEQLAIGRHGLDGGKGIGGAHQPHHLPPAIAGAQQFRQFLDIAIGCRAKAGDDVHRIAQLLQDGIVGNGANLAQGHGAVGGKVALAAALAAAGVVQQAEPEGGEGAAVGAAGQMILLHPSDGAIEIEGQVCAAIEGIGRRIGVGFGWGCFGKAGEGGQCQLWRAEKQIAIAALKTHLRFQPQASPHKASPRPGAERPGQPVGKGGGMRAAPHALAMGVEDEGGQIAQIVGHHRFGQTALQPFDGKGGGDLTDKAPGIGKAGLDADPPARTGIGTIGWFGQHRIQQAPAVFQRVFRLEQGRDIHLAFHAKQPGEIERRQHRGRLLALGHQHADGAVGIDVVQNLRGGEKQADGRGILDGQRREVRAQRFGIGQQIAHLHQRRLTRKIELAGGVEAATDGVLQLRGVHPEMHPAHAQPIGAHGHRRHQQGLGGGVIGGLRAGLQFGDGGGKAGQLVGMVGGEDIGGGGYGGGFGQIGGEQRGHLARPRGGAAKGCGDVGRGLGQRLGIACQPLRLFLQPIADAAVPADIGAPVHVVAHPAGEAEGQRLQLAPAAGPAGGGGAEQPGGDDVARALRPGDGGHGGAVFGIQRDAIPHGRDTVQRGGGRVCRAGGCGNRRTLRARQQESGVGGEHNMGQRPPPARGESGKVASLGQRCHPRGIGRGLDGADKVAQAPGTGGEALGLQLGHQCFHGIKGELATFQPAGHFEAQLEHRIEQRRFCGALVQMLQALGEGGNLAHRLKTPLLAHAQWIHTLPALSRNAARLGAGGMLSTA